MDKRPIHSSHLVLSIIVLCLFADDERFELCTINPGFIMGPVLQGSTCTSMEVDLMFYPVISLSYWVGGWIVEGTTNVVRKDRGERKLVLSYFAVKHN